MGDLSPEEIKALNDEFHRINAMTTQELLKSIQPIDGKPSKYVHFTYPTGFMVVEIRGERYMVDHTGVSIIVDG